MVARREQLLQFSVAGVVECFSGALQEAGLADGVFWGARDGDWGVRSKARLSGFCSLGAMIEREEIGTWFVVGKG